MYSTIATYRFVIIGLATPEGIARKDDNGDWVYDYYLKDHLGNVRAVITNEDAVVEEEIATIEWPLRGLENLGFDNIEETGENEPPGYPYDPNNPENAMVSSLSAALGDVIGPAKLMRVGEGTPIELDVQYWYTEYPGEPLTDVTEILAGVLINLGTASTGLITSGVGEGMDLLNNVTTPQFAALHDFIEDSFDTLNLSVPQAYLVYMYFSQDSLMVMPQYSGVVQVSEPNALTNMGDISILPNVDGFLYTYVTNRSTGNVHFDNLSIRYWKPQVRVQYDYYPYGLPWENPVATSPENLHDCAYQDKEFQFAEFSDGSGLALYDFHARMYDPATASWSVPDPAAQFANPYLAMGNNPVISIDPDGQFIWAPVIIGAVVGGLINGSQYQQQDKRFIDGFWRGAVTGAVGGALGQVGGGGLITNVLWGAGEGAVTGALGAALNNGNVDKGLVNGAIIGGAFGLFTTGLEAYSNYRNHYGFKSNNKVLSDLLKSGDYQMSIEYVQKLYGMEYNYQGDAVNMTYNPDLTDAYGITNPYSGDITIGPAAIEDPNIFKATIVHEYGHSVRERILDQFGNFEDWGYVNWSGSSDPILIGDGPIGYSQEIYNQGRMHIKLNAITMRVGGEAVNPLWYEWQHGISKWIYAIPHRFTSPVPIPLIWY